MNWRLKEDNSMAFVNSSFNALYSKPNTKNYWKRFHFHLYACYHNDNNNTSRVKIVSQQSMQSKMKKVELGPFWDNLDNLSNQLADFCAIHNYPAGVLPTNVFLRTKGAYVLVEAIAKHGGPEIVAQKLGWQLPKQKKWTPVRAVLRNRELDALTEEVVRLMEERNLPKNEMPSRNTIRKYKPVLMNKISAGRSYYEQITQRLGFKVEKKTRKKRHKEDGKIEEDNKKRAWGYWTDVNNIGKELENFCKQNNFKQHIVPASQQLLSKGRGDIWYAIARKGGERKVASQLGLHCNQDWRYFEEFLYLVKQIHQFCLVHNCKGMMPSYRTFRLAGRSDLATLVLRHGGTIALGARLGLQLSCNTAKSRLLNWGPFSIEFAIDCLEFTKQHCNVVEGMIRMPTEQCMLSHGRKDLVDTMETFGGAVQVARRLGLAPPHDRDWAWLAVDGISENRNDG